MQTAIYYRDSELITDEQLTLMKKLWGNVNCKFYDSDKVNGYMYYTKPLWNDGYQTGLLSTINYLSTIQNNKSLNDKEIQLIERIKKGLTPSKSRPYNYVEEKLLFDLVIEAQKLAKYQGADMTQFVNESNELPWDDLRRIYGLPYSSIINKVERQNEIVSMIPKAELIYDYEIIYPGTHYNEECYKTYGVKLPNISHNYSIKNKTSAILKKLPFCGKLYYSTLWDEKYWQIYVYDYHDSDNALQVVLHHLLEK